MGTSILDEIIKELKRSRKVMPNYPDHVAAQAGIVSACAGQLMGEALASKYSKGKKEVSPEEQQKRLRAEAVRTAAACIRFLEHLKH
jgi:hypothetical protein